MKKLLLLLALTMCMASSITAQDDYRWRYDLRVFNDEDAINYNDVYKVEMFATGQPGSFVPLEFIDTTHLSLSSHEISLSTLTKNQTSQDYLVVTNTDGDALRLPKASLSIAFSQITSVPQFVPPGVVSEFAGSTAPTGYFLCDGTAISRSTYGALFTAIGTTYGVGDGSTTFNVPNTAQRFPLGKASSGTGSTLGSSGGLVDHVHTVDPPSTASGAPSATASVTNVALMAVASATHTHTTDIAQFDSGTANPPYLVFNYIIKF